MKSEADLRQHLLRLDGRGYKAYKEIQGVYDFRPFTLFIDHVQGDPFAAPSKIRVRVGHTVAGFPSHLWNNKIRAVAFRDFLTRTIHAAIPKRIDRNHGMGKSGMIFIDVGGQEVLERTSVILGHDWVEGRLEVGLPANGRTILGKQAAALLCQEIPRIVNEGLFWCQVSQSACQRFVDHIENFFSIQSQLASRELVAFVANGAQLPRVNGASDHPLVGSQVRQFYAPESLQVSFEVPHAVEGLDGQMEKITGLGVPMGVTLIVGGGYHGKSTLLQALQRGVYPHIPGDGRELVVTLPEAVKIRAEDGRRVEQVDISGFIRQLPYGRSTKAFCSDDASGSTSQAAGIMEALEIGAKVLLLDEDTSATNFMVRDARMQALVKHECEPITPFLDRVRELYEILGISTILVMGGCGDYFDEVDTVILMNEFSPQDVTAEARLVATRFPSKRQREVRKSLFGISHRIPKGQSLSAKRGKSSAKISAKSLQVLSFGNESIHLQGVEQLVDISQTRAIGYALYFASQELMSGTHTVKEVVSQLQQWFDAHGLDVLSLNASPGHHPGNFARPRIFELAAALNRMRTVLMHQQHSD